MHSLVEPFFAILISLVSILAAGDDVYIAKSAVLKVKDQREIASSATGIVTESNIVEGKSVVMDERLIVVDAKNAELDVERLKQEFELAEKDASSNVEIVYAQKSKLVAQADLDRARVSNQQLPGAFPPGGDGQAGFIG